MKEEDNLKDQCGGWSKILNYILNMWGVLLWIWTELVTAFFFRMGINIMTISVTIIISTKFCYVELIMKIVPLMSSSQPTM